MKTYIKILLNCSALALFPLVADAAGTYYNRTYDASAQPRNNYESDAFARPVQGYGQGYNPAYNPVYASGNERNEPEYYGANSRYSADAKYGNGYYNNNYANNRNGSRLKQSNARRNPVSEQNDFKLDAGLSHQFAWWSFDMKNAGSKLHYDDLNWNVFDAQGKYDFYVGNTKMRVNFGGQYGLQYGDSTMNDDDITMGGYDSSTAFMIDLDDDGIGDEVWQPHGSALSVGTSSGGDMFGFHAGLGLVDFWRYGNLRITPSVGYRYLKYKLETKNNYGMSVETVLGAENYCITNNGETQCMPYLNFINSEGEVEVGVVTGLDYDDDGNADVAAISIPDAAAYVDTLGTFYYHQAGVSHSYETEWAGPYVALDLEYDMTKDDALNAHVEFGLPVYNVTADQPYRPDLQHTKSFEDKGSMGDAYHFGLGANWLHVLSDSVMLTLGMTFDYYHVSGADAITHFNSAFYTAAYKDPAEANIQAIIDTYGTNTAEWSADVVAAYNDNVEMVNYIDSLAAAGWQQKTPGEIESLYKSMGIRLGIQAKF